ncbi:TetR/AcrR family transcriptional regulator [Hafnia alvei]|jgi:TetR/AcrR family transcriptional repressor of nem operon|uniref:TetR family transcriptional regulator n=1 Tax=Obesumbacterium proteus ATCC 12841 TaxID=1354268 RepID=A0AA91IPP4_9GAMM|nr:MULTISPECIES: TetR/AcrR family transcriptional regulator [Hafniaceae]MDN6632530.1 TetR/AcrR family transcriptional regulator [Enterobacterales bacterium]AMO79831.1 transcriptional repressor NemR [Obesumbacterium proteus]KKI48555.1 transcriptional repressor NemR [Obesumbacterium proteus]MCE9884707.1 TetR/AcrR family transcriptional regulator [Obesumbacterium proteus]MCE9917772.1 TetR/AcrR family transcriptional regulator [Obesumbacterium proteus]
MNKTTSTTNSTCEHILDVGEELILNLGFTAMGLNELLATAGVPKGSFYHYFKSKEKFGEAMLTRYFSDYVIMLKEKFSDGQKTQRQHLLDYFSHWMTQSCETVCHSKCLVVKLAGEVSDLSEVMREALDSGITRVIAQLQSSIESGVEEGSLVIEESPELLADSLYSLWLGAALRAKVNRSDAPFVSAMQRTERLLKPGTI